MSECLYDVMRQVCGCKHSYMRYNSSTPTCDGIQENICSAKLGQPGGNIFEIPVLAVQVDIMVVGSM